MIRRTHLLRIEIVFLLFLWCVLLAEIPLMQRQSNKFIIVQNYPAYWPQYNRGRGPQYWLLYIIYITAYKRMSADIECEAGSPWTDRTFIHSFRQRIQRPNCSCRGLKINLTSCWMKSDLPLSLREPSISRITCRRSPSGAHCSWNVRTFATWSSAKASLAESAQDGGKNQHLQTVYQAAGRPDYQLKGSYIWDPSHTSI